MLPKQKQNMEKNMNKKNLKYGAAVLMLSALASSAFIVGAQDTSATTIDPATSAAVESLRPGRGFRDGGMLTIVAETLGLEPADLLTQLQAGQTIAQIAEAQDVSTEAIVEAVIASHEENLTAAVEDGTLTQAQADAHLALAQANIEAALDRVWEFPTRGDGSFGGNRPGGMGDGGNRPDGMGGGNRPGGMGDGGNRPGGNRPGGNWGAPPAQDQAPADTAPTTPEATVTPNV